MAAVRLFHVHHVWEDYLGMVLGALIVSTAWTIGDSPNQAVSINAAFIGVMVLVLSVSELVDLHRWEEGLEAACGLWLMAAPSIFGYADEGTLRYWHLALGAAVVLLATLALRQDWKLSDAELARHSGQ